MAPPGEKGEMSQSNTVEQEDDSQAFLEYQRHECKRAKRSFRLLRTNDELEQSIADVVNDLLKDEPKLGGYKQI